jgi:hypothetical protein
LLLITARFIVTDTKACCCILFEASIVQDNQSCLWLFSWSSNVHLLFRTFRCVIAFTNASLYYLFLNHINLVCNMPLHRV